MAGDGTPGPKIVGPNDGAYVDLTSIGCRFMVGGDESGGGFSLVEHPMQPRALAAPLHKHSREDEYSYVLEGRMGAVLGEDVVHAEVGDLVFKPRDQWHTFWNAGDEPARILEIISPAGFERYFAEVAELVKDGHPDQRLMSELLGRYGFEVDPTSIPQLVQEHGLVFPG